MRRLVYAPKVWIFIRSSNLQGKIFDVSSDLVRGSVTQNLGDVSSLSFELRNRYKKWLRVPGQQNKVIFLPMDLVTVWMQRISARPVQVFTGYLDEVPYYQSYPGNAIFKATCTLKKLAYNWFDPGLPFYQTWLQAAGGNLWALDPTTGEALGLASFGSGTSGSINDSGMATLLASFMVDICGWPADEILIGGIPDYISTLAKDILLKIVEPQAQADQKFLESFLKQYLELRGWDGGPTAVPNADVSLRNGAPANGRTTKSSTGNFIASPKILSVVDRIDDVASVNNIPTIVPVLAGFLMTNMNPDYRESGADGNPNWGYGLYALRSDNNQTPKQLGRVSNNFADPAAQVVIDGVPVDNIYNIQVATQVFSRKLLQAPGAWVDGARNNDPQAMVQWIEAALGRSIPSGQSVNDAFVDAKQATLSALTVSPIALPIENIDPKTVSVTDSPVQSLLMPQEKQVLNNQYQNADPSISKIILQAKATSPALRVSGLPSLQPNEVYINGPANDVASFYNALIGDSTNLYVQTNVGGSARTLRSGVGSGLPIRPNLPGTGILIGVDTTKVHIDAPAGSGGQSPGAPLTISLSQLGTFSFDASFAANFSFPTNVPESLSLTGDKALMNDISCLDGVKQFCQASLRTFRSLPDGRFLAFYPDYFGAKRKPYWHIYDIELIDFGIQLNDEALATHVYVVGDTLDPTDPSNWMNEINSRGVATIQQAESLGFIAPEGGAVTPHNPEAFLKHYGARPHKEEEPMIRSTFYEFFLAWQRFMFLWSQQFATNIQMTFQPEVMAGGIIEFKDHSVQAFVESVTHNFDYASGFTTEATLSAPALTADAPQGAVNQLPGFVMVSATAEWASNVVGLKRDTANTPPDSSSGHGGV